MQILESSDLYLRTLFSQYQHSVWYPGWRENVEAATSVLLSSPSHSDNNSITDKSTTSAFIPQEPPSRSITAKHVSAVFARYGYDPRSGHKVFHLLYDVLVKLKKERSSSSYGSSSCSLQLSPDVTEESAAEISVHEEQMRDQVNFYYLYSFPTWILVDSSMAFFYIYLALTFLICCSTVFL